MFNLLSTTRNQKEMNVTTEFSLNASNSVNTGHKLPHYKVNKLDNSGISDVLKRPTLIKTYNWAQGAALDLTFWPWDDFLKAPNIKEKIDYYYLLRGVLKIKVVVTASPGMYGFARLAYRPMKNLNPAEIVEVVGYDGYKVPLSQRPGIDINIQDNAGGEMSLPFLWHKEWLDLTDGEEPPKLGEFNLRSFTSLNAVTATSQDATIQIFAWMDEYELSGPTDSAALQSGEAPKDEFSESNGAISKPASSIASVAGALTSAPIIGPFARATEIGASAVGSIAKLFGYTNPPVIDDVKPFKNASVPPVATTDICQPYERLALDSKNELSIDNSLRGYTRKDELDISYICEIPSYLDHQTWQQSDLPGTTIHTMRVSPQMFALDGLLPAYRIQSTPMNMVCQNFSYWRGDIVFGIKVIASKMHTGSLRITYDPRSDITASDPPFQRTTNWVMDITQDTYSEFTIPFANERAFCQVSDDIINPRHGSNVTGPSDPRYENGTVTISVLTQQSCYAADADIILLLYTYGKNMQFMGPKEVSSNIQYYPLQSEDIGIEKTSDEFTTPSSGSDDKIACIYGGERCPSLRTLLHRMVRVESIPNASDTADHVRIVKMLRSRYPLLRGFDPNAIYTFTSALVPPTQVPFNLASNNPFSLIVTCYVGSYGSVNWLVASNDVSRQGVQYLDRSPDQLSVSDYYSESGMSSTGRNDVAATMNYHQTAGNTGRNLALKHLAPIQANVPYYSSCKFRGNSASQRTLGVEIDQTNRDSIRIVSICNSKDSNPINETNHLYFGTGPDFGVICFLNVPTWHYLA